MSTVKQLSSKKPENYSEDDWNGRMDADTLARAQIILADESRTKRARLWAAVMVQDENEQADAMRRVAEDG